jgi:hypothetical protein
MAREAGGLDLRSIRSGSPVVIASEQCAVAVMQLQCRILQRARDWGAVDLQRWADRAKEDAFRIAASQDDTIDQYVVVYLDIRAYRQICQFAGMRWLQIINLDQSDAGLVAGAANTV